MELLGRLSVTLIALVVAVLSGVWIWNHYLYSPWTRDGRVRADVITIAPDISGWVTVSYIHDNQEVKKGDVLFIVDDTRYKAEISERQANMQYALRAWNLARTQYERRVPLGRLKAVSKEEVDNYRMQAKLAESEYQLKKAQLETAKINLTRTKVIAPSDGTITNINLQQGNYVIQGSPVLSIVRAGSFYVTGYFEETKIARIKVGQKATLALMGETKPLTGKVISIAKGIANTNTDSDAQLLPQVQQTFNWVRLAQRIPVDIKLDQISSGINLSAGMSVSIQLEDI